MKLDLRMRLLVLIGLLPALAACAPAVAPTPAPPLTTATINPASASPVSPATVVSSTSAAGPTAGGTLIVAQSYEASKLDPHRSGAGSQLVPIMQACETLVIRKADGFYAAGLATSWDISEDGTKYTFKLRKDIKFHDGTPFNAQAVKYNFDRIVDPALKSEKAIDYLRPYLKTDVVDDYTAVVNLKSPLGALMDGIASVELCMVSPTAAQKWGPDEFQDHIVGTGPFIFKEWKRGEYVRLEKNPNYWGGPEIFAHRGQAYLDAIVFKIVAEASVRTGTLETGEIQMAQEVPAIDVKRLTTKPGIDIVSKPAPGTGIKLLLNMSKSPTDDLRVRQAINYAVNQKVIVDTLYEGLMAPAYGPLSSATPCYWAGAEKMYPFDAAKARALLEEAGWKLNSATGIREKNGMPLRMDFPIHGGMATIRDPAPMIQSQLREVGMDINVIPLASPAWLEAGRKGNLNMSLVDRQASDPDFVLRIAYHSENSTGFAWNWHKNIKLDDLLNQGMVTSDPKKRCGIYEQVQRILMDDAMIKPINMYSPIWGIRSEVKGIRFDDVMPSYFWAFDTYLVKK